MRSPRARAALAAAAALLLCGAPLAAQAADSLRAQAEAAYRRRDYDASAALYARLTAMTSPSALDLYNAACSAALAGRPSEALDLLRRALDAGFDEFGLLLDGDTDLATVRTLPGWQAVAAQARERADAQERMMTSLPAPGAPLRDLATAGPFATYLALEDMAAAHPDAPAQWRGALDELRGWMRAIVGDPAGALALEPRNPVSGDLPGGFDALAPVPAVPAILQAARGHRVVMVNEGHHVPQGRVLTRELLRGLYDQGFRYLAVEAINRNAAEALARDRRIVGSTGLYTREPVFAQLLREALAMGWTLVPYDTYPANCRPTEEDPNRCSSLRDSLGAENIVAATFARDADAKVFVHAGYSHVVKVPRPGGTQWLASWLQRKGFEPLAVDQTEMRERGAPESEPAAYRRAEALGWLREPVVLRGGDGFYRSTAEGFGSVDLQVFTPRTRLAHGRPEWLFSRGGREAVALDRAVVQAVSEEGGPFLVQAFLADDPEDAVAVDQFVVAGGEPPSLALPRGRYRVVVTGRAGEVMRTTADVR